MDAVPAMLAAVLLIATLIPYGVALPSTAPAFLWSPHQDESKEAVNYQTLSGQELAKSVLSEGAWSNFLCRRKNLEPSVDLALVFVGTELQSGDISGIKQADPALINLLKVFYMNSNFSMAFPYVAASGEKETMESSLMSGIMEACENDLDVSNVALLESCSVENDNFKKLADLSSVNEYLVSTVEKSPKGKPDLLVICHGSSQSSGELGNRQLESEIFSQLMNSVEQSQRKYAVLYVSNPYRPSQYSSYPGIQRFLAEGAIGNESGKPIICDEVCQIKSSLLEGLLVETPTRVHFEVFRSHPL